jgi:hypothetical protein
MNNVHHQPSFLPLSVNHDIDGNVDFLANKTKKNYINLKGINDNETIECVKSFAVRYHIWSESDVIVVAKRNVRYIPEMFHNISFVINFYNMARETYEKRPVLNKVPLHESTNSIEEPIVISDIIEEELDDIDLIDSEENELISETPVKRIRKNKSLYVTDNHKKYSKDNVILVSKK